MKKNFILFLIIFSLLANVYAVDTGINPSYPDGIETIADQTATGNIIPVTKGSLKTTTYTVPANYNLHVTNIYVPGGGKGLLVKHGITTPSSAATAADSGTGSVQGIDTGTYYYKVTFYSSYSGLESNVSASANATTPSDTYVVNLTSIPTSTDNSVTARKIYRTKLDDTTVYYLLTTIADNTTTIYEDSKDDTELGSVFSYTTPTNIQLVGENFNKSIRDSKNNSLKKSLIFKEGDILTAYSDKVVINGYLALASVIPITINKLSTTNYTVPDNKVLFINNVYANREGKSLKITPKIDNPDNAVTVADSTAVSTNAAAGEYYYKYSFYSSLTGVESLLSEADNTTVVDSSVDVTIAVSTNSAVDQRKIYRTKIGDTDSYYLLTTVSNNTATYYNDIKNDTELGAAYVRPTETAVTIASRLFNMSTDELKGESLSMPIIVAEENVISASKDSIAINGYLINNE